MRRFVLLLLATLVVSELSEECSYVSDVRILNQTDKVKTCFESYQLDQQVLDAIVRNLEIIHDIYPYTDIAQNPPSEPAGYFRKMNFTSALQELKTGFAESDRIVSKVFRLTQGLIHGLRDGHFSLRISPAKDPYNNIFARVYAFFPFTWDIVVDGDARIIKVHNGDQFFLSQETCSKIEELYTQGHNLTSVNGEDPFDFFTKFFGDYNEMKSPQGALVLTEMMRMFSVLEYPLDNLFDAFQMTFTDGTTIDFRMAFFNQAVSPRSSRDLDFKLKLRKPIPIVTLEQEMEIKSIIKNFEKRSVRSPHKYVICDSKTLPEGSMNYMQIDSFGYDGSQAKLFLQELQECVSDFDENNSPITLILPFNGGGSPSLLIATQFLLMPTTDYRIVDAVKKSDRSKEIAPYIMSGYQWSKDGETCNAMRKMAEFQKFYEETVVDDFGNGVLHHRTKKAFEDLKNDIKPLLAHKMKKNLRKPTDIIVATDGYCFSSCALLVDNIILSGGAIAAGYGATNPGGDLFAAAQCPSGVITPSSMFDETQNTSVLGLDFSSTYVESYRITPEMSEIIPLDYEIIPIDRHTGYYDHYNPEDDEDITKLLSKTYAVYEQFKTQCNPRNSRLLLVTDECKSDKPNVIRSGYACGSNGEWNNTDCKVAACKEGYVVDFVKDECIPNPCYPTDEPSSSTKSYSSSTSLQPLMAMVVMASVLLYQFL